MHLLAACGPVVLKPWPEEDEEGGQVEPLRSARGLNEMTPVL